MIAVKQLKVIYLIGQYLLYWSLYCVTPFCPWYNPQIRSLLLLDKSCHQTFSSLQASGSMINDHSSSFHLFHKFFLHFSRFFCIQWSMITVPVHPLDNWSSPPKTNLPHYSMSQPPHCFFSLKGFWQLWVFSTAEHPLSSRISSICLAISLFLCLVMCKYIACQLEN